MGGVAVSGTGGGLISIVIDGASIDFAAYVKSEYDEASCLLMIFFPFNK